MSTLYRGEPLPGWLLTPKAYEAEILPVGYLFQKYRVIPGLGKSDEYERLSLTMQGVLPRSRDASDGLQPESLDGYQLVNKDQLIFKLIDLQNVSTSRVGLSGYTGLVSPAYIVVQSCNLVEPKYSYWYFMDLYLRRVFNRLSEDGVRSSLPWDGLKELPFLLPTKEVQRRIVRFLDAETHKIDQLIQKYSDLIRVTNARLTTWREINFLGTTSREPFKDPPKDWEVIRNKHIFEHVDVKSTSGDEEMLSVSHITGVTPRSMKTVNMFEAESTVGYNLVGPDELVINTMWAWMGALGVSKYEGIVSPSYDVYRLRGSVSANPMFFDTLYRTNSYINLMKANSRGIWESRLRLYPEVFLRLYTVLPPLEVQDRLVTENLERTTEANNLINRCETAIGLLQERRTALISAAVTGQIEV